VSIWTSNSYGTITYLLSIPLKASNDSKFGIGAAPGGIIGLGFETGSQGFEPENRERERFGESGEPSDTTFGGNPGDWSERGRTMPHRPRMSPRFEPIKFWTQVTLAAEK
jgi:hypothetical protein